MEILTTPTPLPDLVEWRAQGGAGFALPNTFDVDALTPEDQRAAVIALQFPAWTDGRAYSQAHVLRSRMGFRGDLRATGQVLVDMAPLLRRGGFASAELAPGQNPAHAARQLQWPTPFYQPNYAALEGRSTTAVERHAQATPGFAQRVQASLALLRLAAANHPGRIVQTTGLGVEGMVLTDLIARHRLPIAVATLDTGMLHAQTLALLPRIEARYGITVEVFKPQAHATIQFVRRHGELGMRESPELRRGCCAVRKLEPMQRLLAGRSALITGLRHEQSAERAAARAIEPDATGRTQYNPLLAWSWADVWHYVHLHHVPYNPLHDAFMPSIGCAPCTRATTAGEPPRAGRWWWESGEEAKECGLHQRQATALAA